MTIFISLAATLLVAAAPLSFGGTAPTADTQAAVSAHMELVVVETAQCTYCDLFRQTVLPAYEASPHAREVPIRFIDATALKGKALGLSAPIDTLPTTVLMRDGTEVGRLTGYVGRENFFRSINALMLRQQ